jgi:Glutathione synthase/Ribosomal protein S6 modification enzyme (glutaminyl transferase)
MILIVSDPADAHVDYVTKELRRRGRGHIILDPAIFPTKCSVSVESGPDGTQRASIEVDGVEVEVSTISGAWYRRPGKLKRSIAMSPSDADWAIQECRHALHGVYESIEFDRWVSHPDSIDRASSKIWQLRTAADLGFEVPPYLLTTDPAAALKFLQMHEYQVVAKSLAQPFVVYSGTAEVVVMYTQLLDEGVASTDLACIANTPTFLQHYIDKVADLRVTVVGDGVFAVEIDPSIDPEAAVDFRSADVFDLSHRLVLLPAKLEAACVALTRGLVSPSVQST